MLNIQKFMGKNTQKMLLSMYDFFNKTINVFCKKKFELNPNIPSNSEKLGLIIENGFKLFIILRKYLEDDNLEEDEGFFFKFLK